MCVVYSLFGVSVVVHTLNAFKKGFTWTEKLSRIISIIFFSLYSLMEIKCFSQNFNGNKGQERDRNFSSSLYNTWRMLTSSTIFKCFFKQNVVIVSVFVMWKCERNKNFESFWFCWAILFVRLENPFWKKLSFTESFPYLLVSASFDYVLSSNFCFSNWAMMIKVCRKRCEINSQSSLN